jgi:transcriptional regulator with XRE-family HTH domain
MAIGERIRAAREARRMSQAELAAAVGISQPAIRKIESGETVRSRYLLPIGNVLGIPAAELTAAFDARAVDSGRRIPGLDRRADRDLPVYASAEGGGGQMLVHIDPVDWVSPNPLASVRGAYSLIVIGESMEPEFFAGDIALVNPHLPPTARATFVFYADDGAGDARAKVKHLLRVTPTDWYVRQWNPPAGEKRDFRMSRREWPRCHRVIGKFSRR